MERLIDVCAIPSPYMTIVYLHTGQHILLLVDCSRGKPVVLLKERQVLDVEPKI